MASTVTNTEQLIDLLKDQLVNGDFPVKVSVPGSEEGYSNIGAILALDGLTETNEREKYFAALPPQAIAENFKRKFKISDVIDILQKLQDRNGKENFYVVVHCQVGNGDLKIGDKYLVTKLSVVTDKSTGIDIAVSLGY